VAHRPRMLGHGKVKFPFFGHTEKTSYRAGARLSQHAIVELKGKSLKRVRGRGTKSDGKQFDFGCLLKKCNTGEEI